MDNVLKGYIALPIGFPPKPATRYAKNLKEKAILCAGQRIADLAYFRRGATIYGRFTRVTQQDARSRRQAVAHE